MLERIQFCFLSNFSLKVQTSVLGLGVDFVLPLSQQEQQEQQEEEQEPSPKSTRKKYTTDLGFGT